MKKALITGIYGQDGSYLCELLTEKGYEVHGLIRKQIGENSARIKNELDRKGIRPILHTVDLNEYEAVKDLLLQTEPDELYHLAAFHVSSEGVGHRQEYYDKQLFDYNVTATSHLLSICAEFLKETKVFTAGSCLMYDASPVMIQSEETAFESDSLYGIAKITENRLVSYYRKKGLFACTGILYNHESHRRAGQFVTKKIIESLIAVQNGEKNKFQLANLDTEKDWGYAKDYVYGMYLMLQAHTPKDYILATGEMHTIQEFVETCAGYLGVDSWRRHLELTPQLVNRKVSCRLCGNSEKIQRDLNWNRTIGFHDMVRKMTAETIALKENRA